MAALPPILDNCFKTTVIAIINTDKLIAFSSTDSTFKLDNTTSTVAINAITKAIATIPTTPFSALDDALIITANIAIIDSIAVVPIANFLGSIRDNTTTAAAITPIATVIAIIFPLQSSAFEAARISIAIIIDKQPTAIMPLAKAPIFTNPKTTLTAANMAMAPAINTKVAPSLSDEFPPNFLTTNINSPIITTNISMAMIPLANAGTDTLPSILHTNANMAIEPATCIKVKPILPLSLLNNLVAAMRPTITIDNIIIPASPLPIFSGSIEPNSLTTKARIPKEIATIIKFLPTFSLPLIILEASISIVITATNSHKPAEAFPRSSHDIVPRIFTAATRAAIDAAKDEKNIFAPSTSFSPITLTACLYTTNMINKATAIPAKLNSPCLSSSGFMAPNLLIANANTNIDAAMATSVPATDWILTLPFSMFIADDPIFSTASANKNNMPAKTATMPTASHKASLSSIKDNATIHPTRIPMAIANFNIPSIRILNAAALESLFKDLPN